MEVRQDRPSQSIPVVGRVYVSLAAGRVEQDGLNLRDTLEERAQLLADVGPDDGSNQQPVQTTPSQASSNMP